MHPTYRSPATAAAGWWRRAGRSEAVRTSAAAGRRMSAAVRLPTRATAARARRWTIAASTVLVTACAGRPRPLDDPDRWRSSECRARFTLEHEESPLAELYELGGWREGFQDRFPAAAIDPSTQRPVTATASFRLADQ